MHCYSLLLSHVQWTSGLCKNRYETVQYKTQIKKTTVTRSSQYEENVATVSPGFPKFCLENTTSDLQKILKGLIHFECRMRNVRGACGQEVGFAARFGEYSKHTYLKKPTITIDLASMKQMSPLFPQYFRSSLFWIMQRRRIGVTVSVYGNCVDYINTSG